MSGSTDFSDLLVINFRVNDIFKDIRWRGIDKLFTAENCARKLFIGNSADLHNIPEDIRNGTRSGITSALVLQGKEAYEFLLKVACGLESNKVAEYHILGEIRAAWNRFRDAHTIKNHTGNKLDKNAVTKAPVVEGLIADARCIREIITRTEYSETSYNLAARKLAGVKAGDTLLIVADKKPMTGELAHALGKSTYHCPAKIIVTHPDPTELQHRMDELRKLQKSKLIESTLESMSFKRALTQGFAQADHVFICAPMDNAPDINEKLISACKEKTHGNVVHLRRSEHFKASSAQWTKKRLPNVILSEQVSKRQDADEKKNQGALKGMLRACHYAALARGNGVEAGKVKYLIAKSSTLPEQDIDITIAHMLALQENSRRKSRNWSPAR